MPTYVEAVKALLRAGFTNRNIIDMSKIDGKDEVIRYGEEAIKDEALAEERKDDTDAGA